MPSFKDRKGNEWRVELDAPMIEEIKDDHGIALVNLDSDPLLKLRNEPMVLVACVSVICREQQKDRGMQPIDFARLLPSPPDAMLDAVRDAVIGFFPSGRASHVREVLTKFDQMGSKTDEISQAKMTQAMNDPKVMAALNWQADQEIAKAIDQLTTGQNAGT